MSGGDLGTQLDRPYAQQPDTRAAAARRVSREEQADMLLDMLGLVDEPEPLVVDGRRCCPDCGHPLPDPISNGGHKPCRRRSCAAGGVR